MDSRYVWPSLWRLLIIRTPFHLGHAYLWCAEGRRDRTEIKDRIRWRKLQIYLLDELGVTWLSASSSYAQHLTLTWTPFDLKNVEPGMTNSLRNHYLSSLPWR